MDLTRPLDDFIKDSLRAKRAEKARVTAERQTKRGVQRSGSRPGGNGKPGINRARTSPGVVVPQPKQRQRQPNATRRFPVRREIEPETLDRGSNTAPRKREAKARPINRSFPERNDMRMSPRESHFPSVDIRDPVPVDKSVMIVVSNLHPDVTRADITELFEAIGPLRKANFRVKEPGKRTNDAEVVFENMEDALEAIKRYNNVPLDNLPLQITLVTGHASNDHRRSPLYR